MSRAMHRRLAALAVGIVIAAGWLFTGMMLIRAGTVTDSTTILVPAPAADHGEGGHHADAGSE